MRKAYYKTIIALICCICALLLSVCRADKAVQTHVTLPWEDTVVLLRFPKENKDFTDGYGAFKMPLALRTIESEAFSGTAASIVELYDMVTSIGDYSFANMRALRQIRIPNSVSFIGQNAFSGSNHVAVLCAPIGYAHDWAKENRIPFIVITSFYPASAAIQTTSLANGKAGSRQPVFDYMETDNEKEKQIGRPAGEVKAARCKEWNASPIQSRSPPMIEDV